jgi:hypothetical protein
MNYLTKAGVKFLNEVGDTKRGSDYIDAAVRRATKDKTDADKEAEAAPPNPVADRIRRLRRMQIDRVMAGAAGGRIYLTSRTGAKAKTNKERDRARLIGQTAGRDAVIAGHVEDPQKFTDLVVRQSDLQRIQDPNDPTLPSGPIGRMFRLARSQVKTQGRMAKYRSN